MVSRCNFHFIGSRKLPSSDWSGYISFCSKRHIRYRNYINTHLWIQNISALGIPRNFSIFLHFGSLFWNQLKLNLNVMLLQINHIDISPNYAGTMMSISNFVSNSCASMAPLVVGFILTDVVSSTFIYHNYISNSNNENGLLIFEDFMKNF